MRQKRSIWAASSLSLFLGLATVGCSDTDSESSDQTAPPRDVGTSSGSDLPDNEAGVATSSARNDVLLQWCEAKSGRDRESCGCILLAVENALEEADFLILSEVAMSDLAEDSSEETIETKFDEQYGADRMTALMETFVSTRTAAKKTCPPSLESKQDPQGS